MTLAVGTGCISAAEDRLRDMLADCKPFQTWLGVSDAEKAKLRIHMTALPPPWTNITDDQTYELDILQGLRPYAQIWTDSFELEVIASPGTPNPAGVLNMRLEENVCQAKEVLLADPDRTFRNTVGTIIHSADPDNPGLVDLLAANSANCLAIRRIIVIGLERTPEDKVATVGDAFATLLEIHWGASS